MTEPRDPTRTPAYKLGYARAWIARPFDAASGPLYKPGTEDARAYEQGYFEGKRDADAIRRQRGFTLMEVLVTLAIVAILATISIPAYGAYILRAAVYDAVVWVEPLKQTVIDNHQAGQPLDAGFTPLANPMKRVQNVTIDATTGVITLHLAAGTVAIAPTSDLSGILVGWDCYGGTLAATHRPAACRP